jgi:hypothetical protein
LFDLTLFGQEVEGYLVLLDESEDFLAGVRSDRLKTVSCIARGKVDTSTVASFDKSKLAGLPIF